MRPLDLLLNEFDRSGRELRQVLLARLARLPLDFESDLLVDFLAGVAEGSDQGLAMEARRALWRQLPRHWDRLVQQPPAARGRTGRSWTRYIYRGATQGEVPAAPIPFEEAHLTWASSIDLLACFIEPLGQIAGTQGHSSMSRLFDCWARSVKRAPRAPWVSL